MLQSEILIVYVTECSVISKFAARLQKIGKAPNF